MENCAHVTVHDGKLCMCWCYW